MKPKKIGLKDIAQKVGVSTATVSYVLNDQPMAARISKEVAEKIKAVAQTLNYQPNQIAKSLKTQRTNTIGLIVADISNPFSAQMTRIIADAAKLHGYTVIVGSSDENRDKAQDLINTMLKRQVDGLIIAAVEQSEAMLFDITKHGTPLVLIDRYFPNTPFDYVGIDNFQATYEAVQCLIENGRKRIGLISYETSLFHLQERDRGYLAALADAGLKHHPQYIQRVSINHLQNTVEAGLEKMLQATTAIDAIVFTTNLLGLNGLRYLKNKAIKIPETLAVIAFDEADFYDFFPVSITHIRQPLKEIGIKATEALIQHIENQREATQLQLKTALIWGQSSG